MTAAGTIPPAKVLVLGAGVAGLQAIATARRLGAVVEAYDVRAAAGEQVKSLGAKFIEVDLGGLQTEDKGGYAKELSPGGAGAGTSGHRQGGQDLRRRHHHRAGSRTPRSADDSRRGGRRDAPRLDHLRSGRARRRKLRTHQAGRDHRLSRRHHLRPAATSWPRCRCTPACCTRAT